MIGIPGITTVGPVPIVLKRKADILQRFESPPGLYPYKNRIEKGNVIIGFRKPKAIGPVHILGYPTGDVVEKKFPIPKGYEFVNAHTFGGYNPRNIFVVGFKLKEVL